MHEQDMIALLQQHDERGMDALLHCGPLMRYIIAPIVPNALDREECLSEASLRVWNKIAQFDAARGSWSAWLTAVTRNTALNFQRSAARHGAGNAGWTAGRGDGAAGGGKGHRAERRAGDQPGADRPQRLAG